MNGLRIAGSLVLLAIHAIAKPGPVLLSGRIVDANRKPLANQTVTYSKSPGEYGHAKTGEDGAFSFYIARDVLCSLNLRDSRLFLAVEVADGETAAIGDVVMDEQSDRLAGALKIVNVAPGLPSIAALYITYPDAVPDKRFDYGVLHLILRNGKDVQPVPEKDQVGVSNPVISAGGSTAGWLVDYENCCTSYPLSMQLTIYAPNKPLRKFHGDGRAIFAWHFLTGDKQVAFHQSFPHGEPHAHNELRNVATGRLIAKWDDDDSTPRPAWTARFD